MFFPWLHHVYFVVLQHLNVRIPARVLSTAPFPQPVFVTFFPVKKPAAKFEILFLVPSAAVLPNPQNMQKTQNKQISMQDRWALWIFRAIILAKQIDYY